MRAIAAGDGLWIWRGECLKINDRDSSFPRQSIHPAPPHRGKMALNSRTTLSPSAQDLHLRVRSRAQGSRSDTSRSKCLRLTEKVDNPTEQENLPHAPLGCEHLPEERAGCKTFLSAAGHSCFNSVQPREPSKHQVLCLLSPA